MDLIDFIRRQAVPDPWSEGEKIPWNEPGFSGRMLQEHLSQEHDAASRRFETIDDHVAWIQQTLLAGKPTRILDLGCGPGLYASRLARLGHVCVGIDFSPASIAYAVKTASEEKLDCSYTEADLREADFGNGYGLAMLIYGELNTFRQAEARGILMKAHEALAEGGSLLLEPHAFEAVRNIGERPPSWYSAENGLFSDRPHIYLMENFWAPQQQATTIRYFILDGLSGEVTRHAASMQAYTDEEYRSLLVECGFGEVEFHEWPDGESGEANKYLFIITSKKRIGMTYDTIIDHAIKWAKDHLGSQAYPFRCLAFVEDAYEKGNGIEIFGGSTAKESADEYGLQTGAEIPPRGAFVFYDCSGPIDGLVENWGHVGLSCGDGRVIHAWDTVREDDYRAVEELQAAPGWTQPQYIGWTPVERILLGHIKKKD